MQQVLLVVDDSAARASLRELLQTHGHSVQDLGTLTEAAHQDLADFSLILTDLRLPGGLGTDLIASAAGTPVIVMADHASLRAAVDAMKLGAAEFIARPFDHDELLLTIGRVQKEQRIVRQNAALRSELSRDYPVAGMIGNCQLMRTLFDRIRKVAPTETTVLVLGESGTGKELVARALHDQSARRDAPMISLNCAAIPDTLIESELFGHEKGAFTGASSARRGLVEAADGGTLFLDEIGELPLEAQARLLRVLQEGEIRRVGSIQTRKVNVRLIAATHRDLHKLAKHGEFREDLFYRLNVVTLSLPPLRDRGRDILELADTMLQRACERLHKPKMRLSEGATRAMLAYGWPGNVRELENAIERAVILCDDDSIPAELLAIDSATRPGITEQPPDAEPEAPVADDHTSLEDYFIRFVLDNEDRMTETELANRLGISRKSLWERRQRLSIPRKRTRNRGPRSTRSSHA